jgi:uncharacterized protein (TIGR03905 family)
MKEITIVPNNVCSREMRVVLDGNKIVSFTAIGGCQGNLRGLEALLVDMSVEEAISRLEGIECHGSRDGKTSCPDQLAKGLKRYLNK